MESNKLIAEFMGIESYEASGYTNYVYSEDNHRTEVDLSYHDSWDWLMPVVEKIESLGYELIITESRCKINHNTDHSIEEVLHLELIGSKIEVTYQAVVEFINQYNKTK